MFHPDAKFRVVRDLETHVLTGWRAAYTGGEQCVIPAGTLLRLRRDAAGVVEPRRQIRFELIDPPTGEAYIGAIFSGGGGVSDVS